MTNQTKQELVDAVENACSLNGDEPLGWDYPLVIERLRELADVAENDRGPVRRVALLPDDLVMLRGLADAPEDQERLEKSIERALKKSSKGQLKAFGMVSGSERDPNTGPPGWQGGMIVESDGQRLPPSADGRHTFYRGPMAA